MAAQQYEFRMAKYSTDKEANEKMPKAIARGWAPISITSGDHSCWVLFRKPKDEAPADDGFAEPPPADAEDDGFGGA